jgi:hypothetical protein
VLTSYAVLSACEQEGLNLSVLLTTLVPSGMVREEDTAWTFESLLRVSLGLLPLLCCSFHQHPTCLAHPMALRIGGTRIFF